MQTKLRVLGLAVVASLLWTSPTSAATLGANQPRVKKQKAKVSYVGTASWYGKQHEGRKMANGKKFDSRKMTAASWYFPLGTAIRVENVKNGQSVIVTITDRGPNRRLHRIIDLSEAAATDLGYIGNGLATVFVSPISIPDTASAAVGGDLVDSVPDRIYLAPETRALNAMM